MFEKIKKYSVFVLCCFLLVWLQYQLWFSDTGLGANISLAHKTEALRQENTLLYVRNQTLAEDVLAYKNSMEPLEEKARSELGFIKPGETFYQIVKKAP